MTVSTSAFAGAFAGCPAVLLHQGDSAGTGQVAADRRDALAQAALFFGQVSLEQIEAALEGVPPGGWRDLSDRFAGSDTRWRFLRPMALPDDPDALTLPPAQRQILVRPQPGGRIAALLVAGLAEPAGGLIAWPILAGVDRNGALFVIDPAQPDTCLWSLDKIAAAAEALPGGETQTPQP